MTRTKTMDVEQYESLVHDILDEHKRTLIDSDTPEVDWVAEINEIFLDYWYDDCFTDYTYSSIANCVHVESPEDVADGQLLWHEGADHVLNDVVYKYVRQDLTERFRNTKDGYRKLIVAHPCLTDLLNDGAYDTPDDAIRSFNKWFVHERTNGDTPASELDPISEDVITPDHITSEELLDPTAETALRALLWWLHSEHTDVYTDHAPASPIEL